MRRKIGPYDPSPFLSALDPDSPGYHVLKRIDRIEPSGDIHVLGDHPQSLDSRIFGPISRKDIVGVAQMVWEF